MIGWELARIQMPYVMGSIVLQTKNTVIFSEEVGLSTITYEEGNLKYKRFPYPISTLPEHLHSTSLSYAETTLNSRKLVSFPLIAHYLSAGPPLPPTPPFTGRPGHTHT